MVESLALPTALVLSLSLSLTRGVLEELFGRVAIEKNAAAAIKVGG